jgi:acyl-CoA-binding protein
MKKKLAFMMVAIFLLVLLVPVGVNAGSSLSVTASSVTTNFPASLTFNISASSGVDITDIRLHYTVDRMHFADVVSEIPVGFTPATRVQAQWLWDMRQTGGQPPGSRVDYWWTISDADGNRLETTPAAVQIEDNRYNWHSLTRDDVTLNWYQGNNAFAGELMDAVQAALSRLSENTGAELTEPIQLYIYATSADLRGSMIYPQEWTGGVAFTEYGIIAIGIAPDASSLAWGKRAIAHELTHLVIHQMTFNPYNSLPTWLDEGLAVNSEGELQSDFVAALSQAISNDSLISTRSLASPFSAYPEVATLSYAESYEAVNYLINEFGREKMLELLNTFKQGSGYDEALNKVYGFDMDGLNARWQASLKAAGIH